MPKNQLDQIETVLADLTKQGNAAARTKELPPGRHADKGYDPDAFNAGMRYAMQKISLAIKQIRGGTFKPSETAKKAPAKKAAAATKAPAKKATATKTAAAKRAPRATKTATVTPIDSARPAAGTQRTIRRVAR